MALAEGGKQKKKNLWFSAAGQVVDIDYGSSALTPTMAQRQGEKGSEKSPSPLAPTMTLTIDKASRLPKEQIGKEVQFTVSGSVKVKTEGSAVGSFDLGFDDIDQDYVRVLGKKLADGTYLITHIVVYLEE